MASANPLKPGAFGAGVLVVSCVLALALSLSATSREGGQDMPPDRLQENLASFSNNRWPEELRQVIPCGRIIVVYRGPAGVIGNVAEGKSLAAGKYGVPLCCSKYGNLHELLHIFGFGHTSAPDSIMQARPSGYGIPGCSYSTRVDINSIVWKYKRLPGATTRGNVDSD